MADRRPTVVIPRGGAWGDRVAAAARERGLDPLVVPLIAAEPAADPAPLDAAVARLVAQADGRPVAAPTGPAAGLAAQPDGRPVAGPTGPDRSAVAGLGAERGAQAAAGASEAAPTGASPTRYAWLVVTSATAVRVLAERTTRLPSDLRIAAVGDRTARAAGAAGWTVDVVPDEASAAALVQVLPDAAGRVLFPRSDIAAPTLVDGLRARGIDVDDVVAYRTVGTGDEPVHLDRVPDAVLVTSGSVATQIARRMTPLDPRTRIACIGPGTAAAARETGLPVHVVGRSRSAEALLDAVVRDLVHTPEDPRSGRSS